MSEYWKSTPSYWCKFCSQYVRDSPLERKNHEASGKHQNNIQRNLRELHKGREREERDKQRAKDEVARLNGLVGDKLSGAKVTSQPAIRPVQAQSVATPTTLAAQRKAHAEQLAAMGVTLPDELKKEVTGVGNYQVVSERVVNPAEGGTISAHRSLAEILADAKRGDSQPQELEAEDQGEDISRRAYKRKAEEIEESRDEEAAPKRQAWGSNIRTYPGKTEAADDGPDLDALLNGVAKKKEPIVKPEKIEEANNVKQENDAEAAKSLNDVPEAGSEANLDVKTENHASYSAPAVVFKKRKGKK